MAERIILLVEDNPDDAILTRRALEKSDVSHRVEVARDGLEALDYLFALGTHADRKASDMPALILLDLKLPKVDGLEVLRRLRADRLTKLIPVIVLSFFVLPTAGDIFGTATNVQWFLQFAVFIACIRFPQDAGQQQPAWRQWGGAVLLLAMGYNVLSMNATSLPKVKKALRNLRLSEACALLEEVMAMDCGRDIGRRLDRFLTAHGMEKFIHSPVE